MNENALSDVGLIGLAVMGRNLTLNMLDHGFKVSVYNRTVSKVHEFLTQENEQTHLRGFDSCFEFAASLCKPRIIVLLVKAGIAVDDFIELLLSYVESGDIIVDAGNSEFLDTDRRCKYLEEKGILFVGSGLSGGEEGARFGPSLMPGGNPKAWPHIKKLFQSISAKAPSGEPCCDWAGSGGAGHFVKMVHNGIEYADMQLISEVYHMLKKYLHLSVDEIAQIFSEWNKGELKSYLIEITKNILAYKDANGEQLIENIRDVSGQKGTGKWTAVCGLERGCPITVIAESVFSRSLSALKKERIEASTLLVGPNTTQADKEMALKKLAEKAPMIEDIRQALYASKIVSYCQGFMLLQTASTEYNWNLNLGGIALMWRGGCIIRSQFLENIKEAFVKNPTLSNLLLDPFFKSIMERSQISWRRVVSNGILSGIPMPGCAATLAFYDAIRSDRLPSNLIQAQRDYFGAHQYELEANPGTWHHTDWTGRGGQTTSSTYQA